MSARSIILRRRRLQKSTNRATPIVLRLTLGTVALIVGLALTAIGISAAAAIGVYNYYAKDLPAPGEIAKQTQSQFKTTRIYDRTGQVLLYEIIDPQGGNRTVVPLDRMPKNCTNATISLEDRNFWNNPGIVTILDLEGNTLAKVEPLHMGSPLLPVNWTGDGQELIFLNADPREGGLLDGWGRRVAMFPDDGHPVLCGTVLNVTGDERDEIVVWDQSRMWIYTQDRPFTGKRIYAPRRNPDYNESNYRTNVSLPGWHDVAGSRQPR